MLPIIPWLLVGFGSYLLIKTLKEEKGDGQRVRKIGTDSTGSRADHGERGGDPQRHRRTRLKERRIINVYENEPDSIGSGNGDDLSGKQNPPIVKNRKGGVSDEQDLHQDGTGDAGSNGDSGQSQDDESNS